MSLNSCLGAIENYIQKFPKEAENGKKFLSHIRTFGVSVFTNNHWNDGHITGSILITNPTHTKVLLMKHKKLGKWLQFGGHSDGKSNVLKTALREFGEESGISQIPNIYTDNQNENFYIFDLDIHDLPPDTKRNGPAHKHYDIRFLGIIDDMIEFTKQEEEVDDIAWLLIDEAKEKIQDRSLLRMIEKLEKIPKITP